MIAAYVAANTEMCAGLILEAPPFFGEAFYKDTFHCGISQEDILKKITCRTLLMKAKTNYDKDNVLLAAMSEEDGLPVNKRIPGSEAAHFECWHGVPIEKKKEFIKAVSEFLL